MTRLPIAVMISGSGSNLQALIEAIEAGTLAARVKLVISNAPEAKGLVRALRHGLSATVIEHRAFPDRQAFDAACLKAIRAAGAEAVILAGFMRILGPEFIAAFPERILNIHPALLPSFPGVHGQADAAAHGVRLSGATVHFVDEKMDHGPIIIQAAVPAYPEDDGASLGARILALEHRVYPQAVQWLATGRLKVEGRKVRLAPADIPPADLSAAGPCLVSPPLEEGF